MPLQNRVTPFSEIRANPARGLFMGNRGILHDASGQIRRHHAHRTWICCLTAFRDRPARALMAPNRYTELFFLDEATALAAGHRPCAECRRADYLAFCAAWQKALGPLPENRPRAQALDAVLHDARLGPDGRKRCFEARLADLPAGTMIATPEGCALFWDGALWDWGFDGYSLRQTALPQRAMVLTPEPIVAVLGAGYRPLCHGSLGNKASPSPDHSTH